ARAVFRERDFRSLGYSCLNRLQDGGAARRYVARLALPANRPAAALIADVVSALAGDVQARQRLRDGQRRLLILQQHERFAHALASDGAMLSRAERPLQTAVGQRRARF